MGILKFLFKKIKFEKNSVAIKRDVIFYFLFFWILFLLWNTGYIHGQTNEYVEKKARSLYEKKMYCDALPLYSQLLSLDKNNPTYAFRFGVCLLHCDKRDIEKPVKYIAQAQGKLTTSDSLYFNYYFGVACHHAFRFGEALRAFTAFLNQRKVPPELLNDARLRMQMCKNGIGLMRYLSELAVLQKFTSDYVNFYRSYDLSKIKGRLGPKPDFLKTPYDRKHEKDQEIVFYHTQSGYVYYSSYGKNGSNGKDIYRIQQLPNGKWGKPEILSPVINTPLDEDYPVLADDGKTLFFCSKGHNSMGGYDIFKSVYDSISNEWSPPQNLDFAINTPFDDILFVPLASMRYAWFASNRMSPQGKVNVFLVRIDKPVQQFTQFSPKVLSADYLQVNSSEYTSTIQMIQRLASLDVNTDEKIYDETDTTKLALWQRYNIPPNPVDTFIINKAFSYTREAERLQTDFSKKRTFYNQLFVAKRNEAVALNRQGEELYNKAVAEKDPEKRKQLIKQATDVLKLSNDRLAESDMAKKMYEQYDQAYAFQEKKLDELLEEAGRVQQTALARKIDTSVTLLIKLIEKVEKFKLDAVQVEKRIIGDPQWIIDEEKQFEKLMTEVDAYEKQLQQLNVTLNDLDANIRATTDEQKKAKLQDEKYALSEQRQQLTALLNKAKDQLESTRSTLTQLRNEMAIRQKLNEECNYAMKNMALDANMDKLALTSDKDNAQTMADKNKDNQLFSQTKETSTRQQMSQLHSNVTSADNESQAKKHTPETIQKHASQQEQSKPITVNSSSQVRTATQQNKTSNVTQTIEEPSIVSNKILKNKFDSLQQVVRDLQQKFSGKLTQLQQEKQNIAKAYAEKKQAYENTLVDNTRSTLAEVNKQGAELQALYERYVVLKTLADAYKQKIEMCSQLLEKLRQANGAIANEADQTLATLASFVEPDIRPSFTKKRDSLSLALENIDEEMQPLLRQQERFQRQRDSLETLLEKTKSRKKREKLNNELQLVSYSSKEVEDEIRPLLQKKNILETQHLFYQQVEDAYASIAKQVPSAMSQKNLNLPPDEVKPISVILSENERQIVADRVIAAKKDKLSVMPSSNWWQHWTSPSSSTSINEVRNLLQNEELENYAQASMYRQAGDALMLKYMMLYNNPTYKQKAEYNSYLAVLESMAKNYYQAAEAYEQAAMDEKFVPKHVEEKINTLPPQLVAQYHHEKFLQAVASRDSLKKLLANVTNVEDRNRLEKQLKEQEEIVRRHYYLSQDLYGVWNNVQFEWMEAYIDLPEQYKQEMIDARKLRSQAARETDVAKKQSLYEQALTKEFAILQSARTLAPAEKVNQLIETLVKEIEKEKSLPIQAFFMSYQQKQDKQMLTLPSLAQVITPYIRKTEAQIQTQKVAQQQENQQTVPHHSVIRETSTTKPIAKEEVRTSSPRSGLYYRIQIAASKKLVEPAKYFEMNAVETDLHNGWYCYMIGYYTCYQDARTELVKWRAGKYKDAFLVAYEEGKRIPLYEARKKDACGNVTVDLSHRMEENMGNILSIAQIDGLIFTVQVGVFATPRTSAQLYGLDSLFYDQMDNGYYRYFNGVYTDLNTAFRQRDIIRKQVPDAFVVAIYQGKKISLAEARNLLQRGIKAGTSVHFEPQTKTMSTSSTEEPIEYRIQIGAYRKQVPIEVVDKMIEVSANMQLEKLLQGDVTCYTIGRFTTYQQAQQFLETRVKAVFPDAFIIKVKGGKKVQPNE